MLGFSHIGSALAHRNYRIYVSGNAVSLVGLWIQRVATGWLTWELTGSGAWLGAMAFADLFPTIVVGPVAGVIADRTDRLRILRIAQSLSMLQAAVLAGLSIAGWIEPYSLLALVAINGIVSGFNQPARLALVGNLVPREALSTAVAINSVVFNLARFVGPALGGALIVAFGVGSAFAANAVSFLAFLLALTLIRIPPQIQGRRHAASDSILAGIREGLDYVAGHAGIGPLLALLAVTGAGARCVVELLPGFADQIFGRGAGGLAALTASVGVGAVLGGVWLARRGGAAGLARVALLNGLGMIATVLLFAYIERFWMALLVAAATGAFMAGTGIAVQTLVQSVAAPEVRGRVLALYGLIVRASPAVGALLVGSASEWFGLQAPLVVSTLACAAFWLWAWRRRRRIARAMAMTD